MNLSARSLRAFILLSFAVLAACATKPEREMTPYERLANADVLIMLNRPVAAERLIHQALQQCAQTEEARCYANGYRMYGLLLMSPVLEEENWRAYFTENGFLDESLDYAGRHAGAIEYFDRAIEQYTLVGYYDAVANVQLNKAAMLTYMNESQAACAAYDGAIEANAENLRRNPDVTRVVPEGYSSLEQFILQQKYDLECATDMSAMPLH